MVFGDLADKSYAARSLSEGAIDYLLKGFMDTRTLERVLRTALERNTLEGLADLLRDQGYRAECELRPPEAMLSQAATHHESALEL
jgi:hypothetical protein